MHVPNYADHPALPTHLAMWLVPAEDPSKALEPPPPRECCCVSAWTICSKLSICGHAERGIEAVCIRGGGGGGGIDICFAHTIELTAHT